MPTNDDPPDYQTDEVDCLLHGTTTVVDYESFTGFAGGTSYVTVLACGCKELDESNDIAAAY